MVFMPLRFPRLLLAEASEVVSPFQEDGGSAAKKSVMGPLDLTLENVELVLDEMRPYLKADGGDVAVRGINGKTVELELQESCFERWHRNIAQISGW